MGNILRIMIAVGSLILLHSCANMQPPEGGEKDMTPPEIKSTDPENEEIFFSSERIILNFDEPIAVENLSENFYMVPQQKEQPKVTVKKNSLVISFNEALQENTTYKLTFKDAIKDLTEQNLIKNYTYTFSTGSFIDSLEVAGNVKDLMSNVLQNNILIGLYLKSDTFVAHSSKPSYFTYSNSAGEFSLTNIKEGVYDLFALTDNNKNQLFDIGTEKIGFRKTLLINKDTSGLMINVSRIDTLKPKIFNSISTYERNIIQLSEGLREAKVQDENGKEILSKINESGKEIFIYNTTNKYDSVLVNMTFTDSSYNTNRDKRNIIFKKGPNTEEYVNYVSSVEPENRILDPTNPELNINLFYPLGNINKPLKIISKDKDIPFDTTLNADKTELSLLIRDLKSDSIALIIPDSALISVFNSYNIRDSIPFYLTETRETGIVKGTITSNGKKFKLQLLNENFTIIKSLENQADYVLKNLQPGNYYLRVLVDENGNGRWDQADLEKFKQPEAVIFYNGIIKVKANWEITGIDITI